MRKIWFLALIAVGMMACVEYNAPSGSGSSGDDDSGSTVDPGDTAIVSSVDTITITWNGANATITGSHDSVSVESNNGYVTVTSTVKDMTYLLSGNGQGQLTIYGTLRHQLVLSNLTLVCSDGPAINNQCHKKCYVVLEAPTA